MSLAKLPVLVRRQISILLADPKTIFLLFAQPFFLGLMIVIAAPGPKLVGTKIFLAYIACIWLGCNNASPLIVRERAVFLREKGAGVSTFQYLLTKLLFVSSISTVQVVVLYLIIKFVGYGTVGSVPWEFSALWVVTLTFCSVGLFISAISSSNTQAAAIVPILVIPQILFSSWVFPLKDWKSARLAPTLCRVFPSYATQRLVDIGAFWGQKVASKDHVEKHNLERHRENLEYAEIPLPMWWGVAAKSEEELSEEWSANTDLRDEGEDMVRDGEVEEGRRKIGEADANMAYRKLVISPERQAAWYEDGDSESIPASDADVADKNFSLYDRSKTFRDSGKAWHSVIVLSCWFFGAFLLAWQSLARAKSD